MRINTGLVRAGDVGWIEQENERRRQLNEKFSAYALAVETEIDQMMIDGRKADAVVEIHQSAFNDVWEQPRWALVMIPTHYGNAQYGLTQWHMTQQNWEGTGPGFWADPRNAARQIASSLRWAAARS